MKRLFRTLLVTLIVALTFTGCEKDPNITSDTPNTEQGEGEDDPRPTPPDDDKPDTSWAEGELAWVFDMNVIPQIHINVTEEQWNTLLREYDRDSNTAEYIHCDATFTSKGETHNFEDAGLRLRGNTSRRRPEGNGGEMHKRDNADWHHCHFMLNLRKYQKDDAHELHNVRKLHLKWHKDDRAYCRELYCYDLFRRFGIWTAVYSSYCRLWIHVEGDNAPAYYGVYEMQETVDDEYLEARAHLFGGHEGNLWKCSYTSDGPATLHYDSDAHKDQLYGLDQDTDQEWTYELKTENFSFSSAKAQLIDFMYKLKTKSGEELHDWLGEVIDIPLFLKTYAVNVTVGMWDD